MLPPVEVFDVQLELSAGRLIDFYVKDVIGMLESRVSLSDIFAPISYLLDQLTEFITSQ